MAITIEKRTITIDETDFLEELKEYCKLFKKHNPSKIGVTIKDINTHFRTKLQEADFYILAEQLDIKVWRGTYFAIKEIIEK